MPCDSTSSTTPRTGRWVQLSRLRMLHSLRKKPGVSLVKLLCSYANRQCLCKGWVSNLLPNRTTLQREVSVEFSYDYCERQAWANKTGFDYTSCVAGLAAQQNRTWYNLGDIDLGERWKAALAAASNLLSMAVTML